ncbi:MAG: biopolymer transporter ExbD [Nevskiaceae bacterium]|nr:MAG: biopolymer transporter ExbD [Nevskiaceae bacterium]TBR73170.1 MAG: biopolymer transporter ExbD [Nevskiaceae bacterium]
MSMPVLGGDGDEMSPVSDINVTPFVDVMLVLLVIFIITAPLMMSQLPLTLPKATLSDMGKPPDPVIVSMDVNDNYYINSAPVPYADFVQSLHKLSEEVPDNTVYVRADKAIPYGKVVNLLKLVGASGFYKVSLVSRAE